MSNPLERERATQVLQLVWRRTLANQVVWREVEARPNAFEADFATGNVEVGTTDNDGVAPYDFKIFVPIGESLAMVAHLTSRHDFGLTETLQALWNTVSAKANNSIQALDRLIAELGDVDDDLPF